MDYTCLNDTALDDGGLLGVLDGTAAGSGGLKGLDNAQALVVGNLAKDNVAAIEPRGNNSGDEELRTVAIIWLVKAATRNLGITHVLGPALAMESKPGLVCFKVKFSSANFSP